MYVRTYLTCERMILFLFASNDACGSLLASYAGLSLQAFACTICVNMLQYGWMDRIPPPSPSGRWIGSINTYFQPTRQLATWTSPFNP